MARPLRIHIAGGWYHVTSRGQRRERIYYDRGDRVEFLKRLEELTKRYGVEVYAYVLMPNHYHLLVRTPGANLSEAMQWLNNGYAMWWNHRHHQVGHVFQGRFKGVLVEGGGRVLDLSLYLHFNPIAIKKLGWAKKEKKAEGLGLKTASAEVVKARVETLRKYRWSSYRAYAGYEKAPNWLSTQEVLGRVKGGREGYRKAAEERLKQGQGEDIWSTIRWGAVLGSEKFAGKLREKLEVTRETHGRRGLRKEVEWEEVVRAVERVKKEEWNHFVNRYGDWGRNLALWVARRRGGMTLREIGDAAGGMDYSAVSEAIRYFERKTLKNVDARRARNRVVEILNLET